MKSGISRKLINKIQDENNIVERISNKQGIVSQNILERILEKEEITELKNSLIYILQKAHETNFDSITPRSARRDSDQINIKDDINYNKDLELICITDEGKETREETRILFNVKNLFSKFVLHLKFSF